MRLSIQLGLDTMSGSQLLRPSNPTLRLHSKMAPKRNITMTTIGGAFSTGKNNFDLIRLLAALLVLFSHSFPLTNSIEPIGYYLGGYGDGGSLAVSVFFVISGFLVTKSVLERDTGIFLISRILRIIPALLAVVLLQTFIIGPAFTTLPLAQYFLSPVTWGHLRNILVFDIRFILPGVFEMLPNHGINGSLWTLPLEATCYLMLPFVALAGLLQPRFIPLLLVAAAVMLFVGVQFWGLSWSNPGLAILSSVSAYPFLQFALFFVIGSALWVHRSTIPINGGFALCCLVLLFAGSWSYFSGPILYLTLPYLVIYAAFSRAIVADSMKQMGDISYGTYLYAFPIQQSIIQVAGGSIGPIALTVAALPLVLLMGKLSSILIEKPALGFRRRRVSEVVPRNWTGL